MGKCEEEILRIAEEVKSIARKEEAMKSKRIRDLIVERLKDIRPKEFKRQIPFSYKSHKGKQQ